MIELHRVEKSFREGERVRQVLRGASGRVAAGEIAVLLGRSGSGKSTLLNLVAGIDRPDAGEIRVAGVALAGLDEERRTLFRRERLGFVFQFFNLVPTLTVEENLLLPLELKGRLGPRERGRARDLLAEVGLADRARAFPDRLSGGEQQRVAIARAIAKRPDLLLCDEPTGALDGKTGRLVLEAIATVNRELGTTTALITHNAVIAAMGDRVVTMKDGGIASIVHNPTRADPAALDW